MLKAGQSGRVSRRTYQAGRIVLQAFRVSTIYINGRSLYIVNRNWSLSLLSDRSCSLWITDAILGLALRLWLGFIDLLPVTVLALRLFIFRCLTRTDGNSYENSRVDSFELLKHFWTMLCFKKLFSLQFDLFKYCLLQCPINLHLDDFLKDVISKRVSSEMWNDSFHSFVLLAWVST